MIPSGTLFATLDLILALKPGFKLPLQALVLLLQFLGPLQQACFSLLCLHSPTMPESTAARALPLPAILRSRTRWKWATPCLDEGSDLGEGSGQRVVVGVQLQAAQAWGIGVVSNLDVIDGGGV
ncbi:hypothetical protein ASPWEDRAFT_168572 [Aspergillus wentii DTO 134E9]|uniref:Uncharacterized protein n=1 Tax=Aspergillus wentii DTO 134E9 TaxID=1073089 RepID=A0A1L9RUS1_ASPWE|nr:uncharacterized protein ASPWEDRAFT_168572 [Aspergillus wentii DTO 134E9]KAI9928598.1 hypothetical protein MW887_001813 [Aspergillus wentii]OJJ38672.1 hypothetical protein ASPWEDRAFT_168572 [Aspergillus wentii DTO 134E9]